jgi:hypothetical protein
LFGVSPDMVKFPFVIVKKLLVLLLCSYCV